MIKKNRRNEGISEAIGFLIMFTIVMTGIAMVSLVGYPLLLNTQISSDEKTMEQAMISIQNDMKILTFSNVPYRDTTIKVSGGSMRTIDNGTSNQTFTISDGGGVIIINNYHPGEIQYESDEGAAVLTLMNGALVRRENLQEGSVMVAEPRWFYDTEEKTLVIYLTTINADKEFYETGIGTVQMSMKTQPVTTDIDYIDLYGSPATIIITYTPDSGDDYSVAWKNYLTGDSIVSGGFNEVSPGIFTLGDVERLVIKEYNVKIESL